MVGGQAQKGPGTEGRVIWKNGDWTKRSWLKSNEAASARIQSTLPAGWREREAAKIMVTSRVDMQNV